jgi:hypothetical protein
MGTYDTIGGTPRDNCNQLDKKEADAVAGCKYLLKLRGHDEIDPLDLECNEETCECPVQEHCRMLAHIGDVFDEILRE